MCVCAEINGQMPQNEEAVQHTVSVIPLPLVSSCIFSSAQDEEKEKAVSCTLKQEQSIKPPHLQVIQLWKPTILVV